MAVLVNAAQRWLVHVVLAAVLVSGANIAHATLTIAPHVSTTLTHDSNLFRLPDDIDVARVLGTDKKSATTTQTAVGAKLDFTQAQQQVSLSGEFQDVRYRQFSFLNYRGGSGDLQWIFPVTHLLSNDVSYHYDSTQSTFSELQAAQRDVVVTERRHWGASLFPQARWRGYFSYDVSDGTHSLDARTNLDYHEARSSLQAVYQGGMINRLAMEWGVTETRFPHRDVIEALFIDDAYRQTVLGPSLDVTLTGHARLQGRMQYTQRRYEHVPALNFQGVTGRVNYDYTPSGKLSWSLAAWRDVGSGSDSIQRYLVAEGLSISPAWEITDKLDLQGRLSYESRDYRGEIVPGTISQQRADAVRSAEVSLNYAYYGCTVRGFLNTQGRSSNQPARGYRNEMLGVSVSYGFRYH